MVRGLRERKKVETRRAIAAAALRLAIDRGPEAVTVDDIAEAAGVSPRTVFNYFPTKDDALLGTDADRRAELRDQVIGRPADEEPLEALSAVLAQAVSGADVGPMWRQRAELVQRYPALRSAQAGAMAALEHELGVAVAVRCRVEPVRHPYPRLVAAVAVAALRSAIDRVVADPDGTTARGALEEAFESLTGGLRPPPASSRSGSGPTRR